MIQRFFCFATILLLSLFTNSSSAQTDSAKGPAIRIVPKLEKPRRAVAPAERDLGGYLMVYFKDPTHSAYFAISKDGYTFTDVNRGQPIFIGSQLAEQKGVRDAHITRGPDGAFYLAMTDLHIYGQRAGYRDSAWERPEAKYGWGNNRALVLMKSYDLVHWTHSDFRVDKAFPELGDIDCSWAPETIYDPIAKRMMVYFTIRYNNKNANIYYSYANDDFTRLETVPKKIEGIDGIDADITRVGSGYQMFYVGDAKIWQATSDKVNAGYKPGGKRIDPEKVSTEAPNVFKRLGTNTWVLMYDIYGLRPNNMGFSETTDFVNFRDVGHFNEGVMKGTNFTSPKHGAVTHLTKKELEALAKYWKVDLK
ncbi:beta-xylosidase [Segetibacter sp. 3557_3]|uniref:glycoside hydrolase family 43 protein n=1 Tax=Segetibacter sp. 3557_3 TaxID=2547429 RepID=UPI001058F4EE|nr:glycoside hydrolase family 43 protein [Segetibacter sp. 3557_3]TDH23960.1 beta-xylosidase [Segetibacter sp. 3557_3]